METVLNNKLAVHVLNPLAPGGHGQCKKKKDNDKTKTMTNNNNNRSSRSSNNNNNNTYISMRPIPGLMKDWA